MISEDQMDADIKAWGEEDAAFDKQVKQADFMSQRMTPDEFMAHPKVLEAATYAFLDADESALHPGDREKVRNYYAKDLGRKALEFARGNSATMGLKAENAMIMRFTKDPNRAKAYKTLFEMYDGGKESPGVNDNDGMYMATALADPINIATLGVGAEATTAVRAAWAGAKMMAGFGGVNSALDVVQDKAAGEQVTGSQAAGRVTKGAATGLVFGAGLGLGAKVVDSALSVGMSRLQRETQEAIIGAGTTDTLVAANADRRGIARLGEMAQAKEAGLFDTYDKARMELDRLGLPEVGVKVVPENINVGKTPEGLDQMASGLYDAAKSEITIADTAGARKTQSFDALLNVIKETDEVINPTVTMNEEVFHAAVDKGLIPEDLWKVIKDNTTVQKYAADPALVSQYEAIGQKDNIIYEAAARYWNELKAKNELPVEKMGPMAQFWQHFTTGSDRSAKQILSDLESGFLGRKKLLESLRTESDLEHFVIEADVIRNSIVPGAKQGMMRDMLLHADTAMDDMAQQGTLDSFTKVFGPHVDELKAAVRNGDFEAAQDLYYKMFSRTEIEKRMGWGMMADYKPSADAVAFEGNFKVVRPHSVYYSLIPLKKNLAPSTVATASKRMEQRLAQQAMNALTVEVRNPGIASRPWIEGTVAGAEKSGTRVVNLANITGDAELALFGEMLMKEEGYVIPLRDETSALKKLTWADIEEKADPLHVDEAFKLWNKLSMLPEAAEKMKRSFKALLVAVNEGAKREGSMSNAELLMHERNKRMFQGLAARLAGGTSDIARTLGALRHLPTNDAEMTRMAAKFAVNDAEGTRTWSQNWLNFIRRNDTDGAVKFAVSSNGELAKESIITIVRSMLMAGAKTFESIAMSNAVMLPYKVLEQQTAGLMSQIPLIGSKATSIGDAAVMARAMLDGNEGMLRHAWNIVQGRESYNLNGELQRAHTAVETLVDRIPVNATNEVGLAFKELAKNIAHYVDVPLKGAGALDYLAGTPLQRGLIEAAAHSRALAESKGDDALYALKRQAYLDDPGAKVLESIEKETADAMMRGEMTAIGRAVAVAVDQIPVLRTQAWFIRSADNAFKFVGTRNVVTAGAFKEFQQAVMAGGRARDKALAGVALGTAFMYGASKIYNEGRLTGDRPSDPVEAAAFDAAGKQANSLMLPDGTWIGYDRMQPFAGFLNLMANTLQISHYTFDNAGRRGKQATEAMFAALGSVSDMLMTKTSAGAFTGLFEAMKSKDQSAFGRVMTGLTSVLVPQVVRDIAKMQDPWKKEQQGILDGFYTILPGIRNDLAYKYDVFGRKMVEGSTMPPFYDMISPFKLKNGKVPQPIEAETVKHKFNLNKANSMLSIDGVKVDLDEVPKAFSQYAQLIGTVKPREFGGVDLMTALNDAVTGKGVMGREYQYGTPGPNGTKENVVQLILGRYRRAAAEQLIRTNDAVREQYALNLKAMQELQLQAQQGEFK